MKDEIGVVLRQARRKVAENWFSSQVGSATPDFSLLFPALHWKVE